jgi:hypothetical protein
MGLRTTEHNNSSDSNHDDDGGTGSNDGDPHPLIGRGPATGRLLPQAAQQIS